MGILRMLHGGKPGPQPSPGREKPCALGFDCRARAARRKIPTLLALAAVFTLLVAACGSLTGGQAGPTATPLPGTVYDPPLQVGDFTLTSNTGQPLSLSDLHGKAVVLFFGYTHCTDVCPTTMADFKRVKAALGGDADRVAFVFISVDGARDTPDVLAAYVHAFDPDFIGLTGDEQTVRAVAQDYGVFFQRVDSGTADYEVQHTSTSFVVDPEGRLRIVFPYQTDPAIMAQRIQALLRGTL
jgi:protein SCO1/2